MLKRIEERVYLLRKRRHKREERIILKFVNKERKLNLPTNVFRYSSGYQSVQIVQIAEHGTKGKENVFVKLWLCIISKKNKSVFVSHSRC